MYRVPIATYRLQFNAQFTLNDARKIVADLRELGISDLYASPLLRARKGSTHGYDVVDTGMINPELGTLDELTELRGELDRHDMGLLLDIVPNHMAISHENAWWMSLLENGESSRYRYYVDIDWREGKLRLPILGRPYGAALESGEIRLGFDGDGFCFDNEQPAHQVLLQKAVIARRLVTNREWLEFIADGGYRAHDLWLSDGWASPPRYRSCL